jgi:two-component system, NarL family, nitrate/nitrite response regulator NarL
VNVQRNMIPHTDSNSHRTAIAPDHAAANTTISLSIVSNSQLLCEGLPVLLASYFNFTLLNSHAGEAPSNSTDLPTCSGHVVLIDSRIGQELALQWIRVWRAQSPPASVVIMELMNESRLIVECIAAGGCAYTLQGASIAELADTIQLARQGLARCSPDVTAQVFARLELAEHILALSPPLEQIPTVLSFREMQVVQCIVRGYSNKQIAAELVISLFTVKHHIHNILGKLKLSQRWDIARLAMQQGWFEPE